MSKKEQKFTYPEYARIAKEADSSSKRQAHVGRTAIAVLPSLIMFYAAGPHPFFEGSAGWSPEMQNVFDFAIALDLVVLVISLVLSLSEARFADRMDKEATRKMREEDPV